MTIWTLLWHYATFAHCWSLDHVSIEDGWFMDYRYEVWKCCKCGASRHENCQYGRWR